jgi:predicted nuclease of predicted toxin-antitoxin system
MPRTIRFHLDENCAGAIAAGLRRHGIDVTTTADAGLLGALDPEQVAYALPLGRVIFTHDGDFLGIHGSGSPHPGIVYCPKDIRTIGQIIDSLILIWELFDPDEMVNRIEFV